LGIHTKARGGANPYDPDWEQYFERRFEIQMAQKLIGYRKLILLIRQFIEKIALAY
jgi:hypothetical protein